MKYGMRFTRYTKKYSISGLDTHLVLTCTDELKTIFKDQGAMLILFFAVFVYPLGIFYCL